MSRVLKVIQPLVAVAFLFLAGCVPNAPGSSAWSVSDVTGQVITSTSLAQASCYVCALSTWDGSSKATLEELRRCLQGITEEKTISQLPMVMLVFFDSPKDDIYVIAAQKWPFVVAEGSRDVATNWCLDTVPTLYYWNGQRLQVRERGYLEEVQWRKLLALPVEKK